MTPALVGLDVGTSGVKAVAVSGSGEVLARAERTYPLSTPQQGWAEQDPEDWWGAAEQALADIRVEPASLFDVAVRGWTKAPWPLETPLVHPIKPRRSLV
jgi:sugar (pentulose or hexulose) kinase